MVIKSVKARNSRSEKSRNGLIDLYRFFFALVVVKSHSLFAFDISGFGPGRVCVEFFFVLSGYLFYSFLERSKDRPLTESFKSFCRSRIFPLLIPLTVGLVSNAISSIVEKDSFNIWGYLWYVEVMLVEMAILVVLRKLIRRDKYFYLTICSIMLVALVLKFSGLMYSWGFVRGASAIPMGILIALLPKLGKKHRWIVVPALCAVFAACFSIVFFEIGNIEWFGFRMLELILDNLLYPALIYLSFCLPVKCKFFSYLGALSFGLYAFQCPADLLRTLGVTSKVFLFLLILSLSLLEDLGKRIYRYLRAGRRKGNALEA